MAKAVPLKDATVVFDEFGGGAPVLLLHGFPATRQLWARVAPSLAEAGQVRVLVPDLVGYGASEAQGEVQVDMASQARWMFQFLDALGVARAAVVAHDVGSAAAQIMLSITPERVRALVVLDGVHGGEWAMGAVEGIKAWDAADASRLFPVLARRLGRSEPLREMLRAYEGERGGLRLIRAARDLDPRQTEHIGRALRAAGVPALVLWGEGDTFLPVETVARPLAEILGARLALLPGGHFTPLDCPEAVVAELRSFLAGLPPDRP